MAKPITIPNTFANATTAIPLSQLDNNYSTITSSINDANTYSNYAADSGAANAYAITLSGVSTTYTAGLRIQFKAANANSGASTLNVNGQGVKNIILTDGSALPANAIVANALVDVMYDGTSFQLLSDSNGGQETLTNVSITGNLTVTGTSGFTGNVTANVATVTTMAGNPSFSGNVTISGTNTNVANLNASGNAAITGTSSFTGNVSANTVTVTSLSDSGNLTFTGTGNRITGDFSNATVASRVTFQTSTTNGSTVIQAIPNGTGTVAGLQLYPNTTGLNTPFFNLLQTNSETQLYSDRTGSGSFVPMTFSTGGSERVRVDSSGNVGIGTNSPSVRLNVQTAATGTTVGSNVIAKFQSNAAGRDATIQLSDNVSNSSTISMLSGATAFSQNGTEAMRIDSSGDVTIGTATVAGRLTVSYNSAAQQGFVLRTTAATFPLSPVVFQTSAGATAGFIGQTAAPSVSYNTTSDYRLKEDIQPMTGALAKVAALKPVTYKWKAGGSDGQGFIAHELAEVVPQCVTGEKDAVDAEGKPQYQGIDTSFLVATLTAALQEQQAIIEQLKADVAALKGKV
jgi:hypothetical protein